MSNLLNNARTSTSYLATCHITEGEERRGRRGGRRGERGGRGEGEGRERGGRGEGEGRERRGKDREGKNRVREK